MEPAERFGSGTTTLGKRQRSRALPRTASMVTVPSAAKQGRRVAVVDAPSSSSSSLPAAASPPGMMGAGEDAPRGGYFSGGVGRFAGAAFLMACGLCNRRLGPGHDTFIYRGEAAFCSQECREQQIENDERMEQTQTCSLTSIKVKDAPSSVSGASGSSDPSGSGGGETVAAA